MNEINAELRSDGLHISGYVNVPGRQSRPVMTRHGKVIEVIEQRAFQRAIERAENIVLTVDHGTQDIASTKSGNLKTWEDEIGLRAETTITDEGTIKAAKEKRIKGWSFTMSHIKDELEQRADGLPIRHVKDFDMSEITLAINTRPVYSATLVEVRSENEESEERAMMCDFSIEGDEPEFDNSAYKERITKIGGYEK